MQIDYQQYIETLVAGIHQEGDVSVLRPLKSVLGTVWNQQIEHYFQADRLSLDKDVILPGTTPTTIPSDFLKRASSELQQLKTLFKGREHSAAYRYTLFHYAQVWGSRVALVQGGADNSVFDHNRIKAAVAICQQQASDSEKPFLLIKGAVGGIQKYIYHDIKAEQIGDADKSSKRLRGRSFLVAHLSQVFAEQVIERLGQTEAQILFVGGGHFHLLLPNTVHLPEKIDKLIAEFNLGLQQSLGTPLSFDLVAVTADETLLSNPSAYFQALDDQLNQAKNRRHQSYLQEILFNKVEMPNRKEEERIGQKAPYAGYIIEVKSADKALLQRIATHYHAGKPNKDKADIACLSFLGLHYFLVKKAGASKKIEAFLDTLKTEVKADFSIKILRLNDTRFLPEPTNVPSDLNLAWGFTFIGNFAPYPRQESTIERSKRDGILMFEELAELDQSGAAKLNYPQLAAMRLDMDDLGALFSYGLGHNTGLERTICLSRELQLFFGAYFNVLAEGHHLYITYSGGDDAFVIGSWINTLHFAAALQQAFATFTCKNTHLGFSAGIYTCNPHYPVARFAKDAEDLQERAKEYQPDPSLPGKNAVCIFNQVYSWERFQAMLSFAQELEWVVPTQSSQQLASGRPIRRSLLQRLLDIIQVSQEDDSVQFNKAFTKKKYEEQKDYEFFRNLGRLHGLMARQGFSVNTTKEGSPADRIIRQLLNESSDRKRFVDYKLAFNYILFKTSEVKTTTYGRNI